MNRCFSFNKKNFLKADQVLLRLARGDVKRGRPRPTLITTPTSLKRRSGFSGMKRCFRPPALETRWDCLLCCMQTRPHSRWGTTTTTVSRYSNLNVINNFVISILASRGSISIQQAIFWVFLLMSKYSMAVTKSLSLPVKMVLSHLH